MKNLASKIEHLHNKKVLVIGDTILDVNTESIPLGFSAETPTFKAEQTQTTPLLGGAGNVASHVSSLGANCTFLTVGGKDSDSSTIKDLGCSQQNLTTILLEVESRKTCVKHRFWVERNGVSYKYFQLNKTENSPIDEDTKNRIFQIIEDEKFDTVVLSDYRLGIFADRDFTERVIRKLRNKGVYVLANGQASNTKFDYQKFLGVDTLVLNENESLIMLDQYDDKHPDMTSLSRVIEARICVTSGDRGANLYEKGSVFYSPAIKVSDLDTCGAGDAFLACFSLLDKDLPPDEKLSIANTWAALSTTKLGTETPSIRTFFDALGEK